MASRPGLLDDDLVFDSLTKCAAYEHSMTEIKDHFECINKKCYPFSRVQFYHNQWIPMVEAFEQKWGSGYVPADIKSSLAEVKKSYPIFVAECTKWNLGVAETKDHFEWINKYYPFP